MNKKLTDQVQQVFRQVFQEPALVISSETTAADVPGWDSLTHMTLIAGLEEFFSIAFTFDEVSRFKNTGDMIRLIAKKTGHAV